MYANMKADFINQGPYINGKAIKRTSDNIRGLIYVNMNPT
jgi:hypothetical protein